MAITPPTDEELNTYIRARLNLLQIDITVLPDATQTSLLSSCRTILRSTVPTISTYVADVQENPPALYPAPFTYWTLEETDRKSLRERRKALGFA
ncbi:MAG: hypothetical protein KIT14_13390 [bacterium]|nr:hypothetical protein [bacterium]